MTTIALLSDDPIQLDRLAQALQTGGTTRRISRHDGSLAQLAAVAEATRAEVIVVHGWDGDGAALQAVEHLMARTPQRIVILTTQAVSPERLLQAMRAGVREVLADDAPPALLEGALSRAEATLALRRPDPASRLIAFLPAKGGSGATFLATNTAYLMGQDGRRVLLLDLNLQFGDAAVTVLDRKPGGDVLQVADNLNRLDAAFLDASTLRVTPRFSILAAPDNPAPPRDLGPDALDAILDLAGRHYDLVLLDLQRSLGPLAIRALDRADSVVLVLQAQWPHLRNASRLVSIFQDLGYPAEKIQILVNRLHRDDPIGLTSLRSSLGVTHLHTVPNGYAEVTRAIGRGMALAELAPRSAVCKALVRLSDTLQHKAPARSSGLIGWLRGRILPTLGVQPHVGP